MAVQYVTSQDVVFALPRDLNRPGQTGADLFDETEIDNAILEAQSEVEMKTGLIYPSVEVVPEILRGVVIDIATYILAIRYDALNVSTNLPADGETSQTAKGGAPDTSHAGSHPVVARWQRAQGILQAIFNGHGVLPAPPPGTIQMRARANVVNPYEGDLFTMDDFDLGYHRYRR